MEIGESIKKFRKNLDLSQKQLAEKIGVSCTAMNQIENNVALPHKATLDKICTALNIPLSFLLYGSISDEDIPPNKFETFNYLKIGLDKLLFDIQKVNNDISTKTIVRYTKFHEDELNADF